MNERIPKMNKEDILKAKDRARMEEQDAENEGGIKEGLDGNSSHQLPAPKETTPLDCIETTQPVQNIHIPTDPPTQQELTDSIPSLIDKAQYLALEALIVKLDNLEDLSPSTLTNIITSLQDLKITTEWTAKLRDAIAKKARVMVPPGSKSSNLTKKLGSLAGHTQDASKQDNREGQNKLRRSDLLLPPPSQD